MKHDSGAKLMIFLICVFFIFLFSACRITGGGIHLHLGPELNSNQVGNAGPPPHAPAHGYRAKYAYRYYPGACAYFDVSRKVYFYLEGDNWMMSVSLPRAIQLQLGDHVTIEMDTAKPYVRFEEHKRKYPPGQLKKKKKKWLNSN